MSEPAKKILFVEDDPIVLNMYRTRLQREGFQFESAEDGQVAIDILPQLKPDVVVLDLMLPKVNGVEVLKFIRADARLKATPVLILSNAYMTELAQKAMQAGASKGILKTECTPSKLVDLIRELLSLPPVLGMFAAANKSYSGSSQAEAYLAAAAAVHSDETSFRTVRSEFLRDAPGEVAKIRDHCLSYIKLAGSPAGMQRLSTLYQRVHFLSARAGLAGCTKVALLASAFEALLFEVVFKPSHATASVLQTIAQAVDCLGRLFQNGETGSAEPNLKAKVLVVDDDAVCNFAMVAALKRAHLDPVSVEDPNVALQLLQAGRYDLVLLDINMPQISGFELCEALRRLPYYKSTPVIFITVNGDFQNRAQSVLSGGNDLITKPASPLELALKTTMHLLQSQARRSDPVEISRRPEASVSVIAEPVRPTLVAVEATTRSGTDLAIADEADLTEVGESASVRPVPDILEKPGSPPPGDLVAADVSASPVVRSEADGIPPIEDAIEIIEVQSGQPHHPEGAGSKEPKEPEKEIAAERSEVTVKNDLPAPGKLDANPPPVPQTGNGTVFETDSRPSSEASVKAEAFSAAPPVKKNVLASVPVETKLELPAAEAAQNVFISSAPESAAPSPVPATVSRNGAAVEVQAGVKDAEGKAVEERDSSGVSRPSQPKATTKPHALRPTVPQSAKKLDPTMENKYTQAFDKIVLEVARVIFGEENLTEMNVRLTRIALERYNVHGVINQLADANEPQVEVSRLSSVSVVG